MTYDWPTSPQELLQAFVKARVSVIQEFSGEIRKDCILLRRWAYNYARENGLVAPEANEDYGIYYDDPEQDAEIYKELDS